MNIQWNAHGKKYLLRRATSDIRPLYTHIVSSFYPFPQVLLKKKNKQNKTQLQQVYSVDNNSNHK